MALLGDEQKISNVLQGQPFGTGSDGILSSATIPTMKKKACTGTATNTKFAADTDASAFDVGDLILLHQTRRASTRGWWEIVRVSSVGSDEYNITTPLVNQYWSLAQATVIKQYSSVTVESGTWTVPDWGGNTGGILVFACNGITTVTGSITAYAKGFRYGTGVEATDGPGDSGEGSGAASTLGVADPDGNGGGAWYIDSAGGGNYSTIAKGSARGTLDYQADLANAGFGGGGAGGVSSNSGTRGGDGGGLIIIISKDITVAGSIINGGEHAPNAPGGQRAGSGGAGGCTLIQAETAALGDTKITALKGNKGGGGTSNENTDGSVGRIALHYSDSYTGSTNPGLDDTEDISLIETGGAFLGLL